MSDVTQCRNCGSSVVIDELICRSCGTAITSAVQFILNAARFGGLWLGAALPFVLWKIFSKTALGFWAQTHGIWDAVIVVAVALLTSWAAYMLVSTSLRGARRRGEALRKGQVRKVRYF
jgi:hypothetical protein